MGRKNGKRWRGKFQILNERIMGLNALWGGWNKAEKETGGVHWECAGLKFKGICRKLLRWPSKLWKVPSSMSNFRSVIGGKGGAYSEVNPAMIHSREVIMEAISLPKEPPDIVPILSILPVEWTRVYEKECNVVSLDPVSWENMRSCKARLGMPQGEYIKIIKLLRQLGMVTLLTVEEVKVVNGMHCVKKENGKQRLIFDGRPVNHILNIPDKVKLPDFSLLEGWQIKEDEEVRFAKLDLDNFYHRLGVPKWLTPYLGLPALPAEMFSLEGRVVYPACSTLPMGLSHSVLLAQLAHLYVLRNVKLAPSINFKVTKETVSWMIVYIDDVIIACKNRCGNVAESEVNLVVTECLQAYKDSKLVINKNKLEWATKEVLGLGCVISEEDCGIRPKHKRIAEIISATRHMLSLEVISPKNVEVILGHWIWFILLYRPLYAVFYHVYKWLALTPLNEDHTVRNLWKSVKREFFLSILFADLCRITWDRRITPTLLAVDASLAGAGACEVIQSVREEEDLRQGLPLNKMGDWQKILNQQWQRVEHINVLEMRSLIMALAPRVNSMEYYGMRWRVFSDSIVVVGAEGGIKAKTTRRFTVGLAPSTVKTYIAAIEKFKNSVAIIKFGDLDCQLLDYIQTFPPLSQRSAGERLTAAWRHFFPEVAHALPRLTRFIHQLKRQYKCISKPPMIWDVVVLVAFQLVALGFPVTALGVLLQFDCFLRPHELAQIKIRHIAFPGGRLLGSQAQRVLLLLPKAKTGPLQSVRVESKLVIKLLAKATKKNSLDTELFPSVTVYRKRLALALQGLGLGHIGYTPHSIRHGAATMALINKGEQALPAIMFRGRWESSAGRSYLQMGAAALLYAEIPEALIEQAEEQMADLPKIFKKLQWTPKI